LIELCKPPRVIRFNRHYRKISIFAVLNMRGQITLALLYKRFKSEQIHEN